ncbi:adenosylmethionine--8-amino-7-oxononanoate transaminase [Mesorhizobium sp. 43Arga]
MPSPILDAISSWWVITHGHRHPKIVAAIRDATETLDQVIFAGLSHEPAEQLAAALVDMTPAGLDWVFYSDSGSTSVEVALKMALGFHRNNGAPRSRIVVMEHSYHGDTIGTMSVGSRGVFNAAYEPLLFEVDTIPFPAAGQEQKTLDAFERLARDHKVAALIVEPLVLGAGGMLMYPARVLTELKRIAERSGTLFIADEVMTGWGRTGTMFACEQAAIAPDILCTSKGLTGGSLPLAATLATDAIFRAHFSTDRAKTFFHSSSYTANPIACAAALANVGIWKDEPVAERVAALSRMQAEKIARFSGDPRFNNVRTTGTIAALDLSVGNAGYLAEVGPRLRAFFLERGLLVRPLGNVIYVLPPYCVTSGELDRLYDAIDEAGELESEGR